MARRPQQVSPKSAILDGDQMLRGVALLKKRIQLLNEFDTQSVDRQFGYVPIEKLEASIDDALIRIFGEGTVEYNRYSPAATFNTGSINMYHETPMAEVREAVETSRQRSLALLEQAVESLEEQIDESPSISIPTTAPVKSLTGKIFIVHGHDAEAREAVARFLTDIGLRPIILHEQANKGKTLIEKFEAEGDVDFAIILLSPDDLGGQASDKLQPRARQNVILELGYFIGKLGRDRVCALKRGDLEIPSDIVGVVYDEYDSAGAWKTALARELQAIGTPIDWNRVMR